MTEAELARVRATGIKGVRGTFPLPVPNGWFGVAQSDELGPGEVLNRHYFGRDLVVFRTGSGRPHVLEAYCAHMGAHLGVGPGAPSSPEPGPGRVAGECLACPFHGWRYDGTGRCVEIPYSQGRIPEQARVRAFPTVEKNGLILAWHHLLDKPPAWELPDLPEFCDPEWVGPVYTDRYIDTSLQDVTENDQDVVHFRYVHGAESVPEQETRFEGRIRYTVGPRRDGGTFSRETFQLGYGVLRIPGSLSFVYASSPIDAEHTHQRWVFVYPRALGDAQARQTIDAFSSSGIYQDIPIWNHKIYRERPLLVQGDGRILEYRRWARQFYSLPGEAAGADG
jgi:phenylpropionate dioxygenase-like ring-hydroxylating dioxygenase large terminal subunit